MSATVLVGLGLLALLVRIWFVVGPAADLPLPGDAAVYREMAGHLADGDGLRLGRPGDDVPELTAEHPPGFPVVLAAFDLVGLQTETEHRLALAVVSSLAVVLLALAGRHAGGDVVGVGAGLIGALHPAWVQPPAMVMSESIHLVLVSAILWRALRGVRSWPDVVVLGSLVGLAALVRPEGLGLLVVVGLPALWRAVRPRRLVAAAALVAVSLAVVGPWVVRNAVRLDTATMSTNAGKTILGSNCADTYSGPLLGGFSYDCFFGVATVLVDARAQEGRTWTAAELDAEMGRIGREHVGDHLGALPKVVAARVVRMWGVAFLDSQLDFDVYEGRHRSAQRLAQWVHLGLLPLAAVGVVAVRRRAGWARLAIVLGPIALATASTLLVYGGTRMRAGAEPSLALLAAAGAVQSVTWWRRRSASGEGPQVA